MLFNTTFALPRRPTIDVGGHGVDESFYKDLRYKPWLKTYFMLNLINPYSQTWLFKLLSENLDPQQLQEYKYEFSRLYVESLYFEPDKSAILRSYPITSAYPYIILKRLLSIYGECKISEEMLTNYAKDVGINISEESNYNDVLDRIVYSQNGKIKLFDLMMEILGNLITDPNFDKCYSLIFEPYCDSYNDCVVFHRDYLTVRYIIKRYQDENTLNELLQAIKREVDNGKSLEEAIVEKLNAYLMQDLVFYFSGFKAIENKYGKIIVSTDYSDFYMSEKEYNRAEYVIEKITNIFESAILPHAEKKPPYYLQTFILPIKNLKEFNVVFDALLTDYKNGSLNFIRAILNYKDSSNNQVSFRDLIQLLTVRLYFVTYNALKDRFIDTYVKKCDNLGNLTKELKTKQDLFNFEFIIYNPKYVKENNKFKLKIAYDIYPLFYIRNSPLRCPLSDSISNAFEKIINEYLSKKVYGELFKRTAELYKEGYYFSALMLFSLVTHYQFIIHFETLSKAKLEKYLKISQVDVDFRKSLVKAITGRFSGFGGIINTAINSVKSFVDSTTGNTYLGIALNDFERMNTDQVFELILEKLSIKDKVKLLYSLGKAFEDALIQSIAKEMLNEESFSKLSTKQLDGLFYAFVRLHAPQRYAIKYLIGCGIPKLSGDRNKLESQDLDEFIKIIQETIKNEGNFNVINFLAKQGCNFCEKIPFANSWPSKPEAFKNVAASVCGLNNGGTWYYNFIRSDEKCEEPFASIMSLYLVMKYSPKGFLKIKQVLEQQGNDLSPDGIKKIANSNIKMSVIMSYSTSHDPINVFEKMDAIFNTMKRCFLYFTFLEMDKNKDGIVDMNELISAYTEEYLKLKYIQDIKNLENPTQLVEENDKIRNAVKNTQVEEEEKEDQIALKTPANEVKVNFKAKTLKSTQCKNGILFDFTKDEKEMIDQATNSKDFVFFGTGDDINVDGVNCRRVDYVVIIKRDILTEQLKEYGIEKDVWKDITGCAFIAAIFYDMFGGWNEDDLLQSEVDKKIKKFYDKVKASCNLEDPKVRAYLMAFFSLKIERDDKVLPIISMILNDEKNDVGRIVYINEEEFKRNTLAYLNVRKKIVNEIFSQWASNQVTHEARLTVFLNALDNYLNALKAQNIGNDKQAFLNRMLEEKLKETPTIPFMFGRFASLDQSIGNAMGKQLGELINALVDDCSEILNKYKKIKPAGRRALMMKRGFEVLSQKFFADIKQGSCNYNTLSINLNEDQELYNGIKTYIYCAFSDDAICSNDRTFAYALMKDESRFIKSCVAAELADLLLCKKQQYDEMDQWFRKANTFKNLFSPDTGFAEYLFSVFS